VEIGIAELEGSHETVGWRERHRPGGGDRREADPLEPGVGLAHVRDDDREMLEPAIRAPAVCRIRLSRRIILDEGHLFLPQAHGQCYRPAIAQSDKMGKSVAGHFAPSDCLEPQPVSVERFSAVQVRNGDQHALDSDDAGRQGRARKSA
jgi:hypothetical protein